MPVAGRTLRGFVPYAMLAVLAAGSGVAAWASPSSSRAELGPEGVALEKGAELAAASTTASGAPVGAMTCQTAAHEVVNYHVHVHLEIFVDGRPVELPAGIGITAPATILTYPTGQFYDVGAHDCLYWLHTHVADGIIHVESPVKEVFTLGQFFDVWRQPLSASRVATAVGPVVVFENGRRWAGDPRSTPLVAQGEIQIDVGTPVVPFQPFTFKVTGGCGEGTLSCSSFAG